MNNRTRLKLHIQRIRKLIISQVLLFTGFERIHDHWIYTPLLNSESRVFDLGANYGDFSAIVKNRFNLKLFLFEANIDLCASIEPSLGLVYNAVVTDRCQLQEFYISDNHEASSISKTLSSEWGNSTKRFVQSVNWPKILDLTDSKDLEISLVKVDIEGAEIAFLNSLGPEELSLIKSISVEFHDWLDKSLHESTKEAIRRILSLNFISVTDAPNHNWPVEMCFLNTRYLNKGFRERIGFFLYKFLKF